MAPCFRSPFHDFAQKGILESVGESQKKPFVILLSYLNQPSFMELLSQAEEEFGYDHPVGGIAIPCSEDTFLDLTCSLSF
ncbi:putative small auxin-up RNA [Rosa chinensis]|uniref:Putative small auxin-up RNA n=1 Tax=Rosa chinensis TaxID=74649 RepID=A0A2P6PA00_ROSCH|nr:putative small auxin-up RNA [Rosa chinensis]